MWGESADHESLEIWSPPLSETVTNLPFIVYTVRAVELLRLLWRSEPDVQATLEAFYLIFAGFKVVTRSAKSQRKKMGKRNVQFEESIGDLEHENMGMPVVMNNENPLYGSSHAKILIIVLKALETGRNGRIFFWLGFLGTKRVELSWMTGITKRSDLKVKFESG